MRFRRMLRLGSMGVLVGGALTIGAFSRSALVRAAACTITTNTTVDQAYITTNSCGSIDISGTTTVTWSGTTDLIGDGTITISSGTVTFSGAMVLGSTDDLTIALGATVTHAQGDTTGVSITARNATIAGTLDANAKGCLGGTVDNGNGPDATTGICGSGLTGSGIGGASGGGYGGAGSKYNSGGSNSATYGSSTAPTFLGSGGGGGAALNAGGNGGGKIYLNLSGTLTESGVIRANGASGSTGGTGGGGSGGSVYVIADAITGVGTMTAAGGNGGSGSCCANSDGGGGGGRIAVYFNTNSGFTLTNITSAKGNSSFDAAYNGVPGTTFILDQVFDDLTVTSGLDFISAGDYTRHDITVNTGAILSCGTYDTLNIGSTGTLAITGATWDCSTVGAVNITAANDFTFTNTTYTGANAGTTSASGGLLTVNGAVSMSLVNSTITSNFSAASLVNFSLDATSVLSANAKGCAGGTVTNGTGPSLTTGICGADLSGYGVGGASGGGYGGAGSKYNSGGSNSATYGDSIAPTFFGSGGGGTSSSSSGGNGGGKIYLNLSGIFTDSGIVRANGAAGTSTGGGGSGGSVYIIAASLAGAGTVTAAGGNGGSASCCGNSDGGGGGGRAAVYYSTNSSFTLANITAAKGNSSNSATYDGVAGTVYTLQTTVPATPSISSPLNAGYNANVNAAITSSAYSSNGASHVSSDWKVTSDSGGSTIVWSKDADTSNLTSMVVNTANGTFSGALAGQTQLVANTAYYVFVRYNNSAGASSWSSAISFTTAATTNTSTKTWDFGTPSDYTFDTTHAVVSGGIGQLTDLGSGLYSTVAPTTLSAWSKIQQITVTETSGTTLTNYQTQVTVTYDADMNADFSDIRFTSADGSTLLDHFLASKTDSVTATFWVEIPTLTASATTNIFMYYGNAAAASASSGSDTFVFFDDFLGGTLDAAKWTGSASLSGGIATVGVSATHLTSLTTFGTNTSMGWRASFPSVGNYGYIGSWSSAITQLVGFYASHPNGGVVNAFARVNADTGTSLGALSGYHIYEAKRNNGVSNKYSVDYADSATISTQVSTALLPADVFSQQQAITVDWVFVRTYTVNEPTTSFGTEAALVTHDNVSIVSAVASVPGFTGLGTFTETRGVTGGQGSTYYNLSLDGTNWKYWNGTVWAAASAGDYSSATVVNSYLPQFTTDIGTGSLYFKAFLIGVNQPVEINTLVLTYASVNVSLTAATQSVAEDVGTVTVTAQLSSTSGSDVTIPYTISGTATAGGVDHTLANGNIVITAGLTTGVATFSVVNDALDEDDETVIVTLGAPDVGSLSGVTEQAITITDNDTSGFTVGTISRNTTEAGVTATATIVLTAQPSADVSIGLTSSNTAEGTVSPASFTFTSLNWSTPQTLTVTGVNDDIDDGDIAYSIVTAAATSSDVLYSGINPADVSVTNTDNDTAGITIGAISGDTTEAGGTATFTVVLNSQPTASVAVDISSSDTSEGTVSPISLPFTTINWSTPQTVTVTGVDDYYDDGNIVYNIVTAAATSADGAYSGVNAADVSVTNTDNDAVGFTIGTITGDTTEAGGTATFTVALAAIPSDDVTFGVSSSNTAEGTVLPSSLTFSVANWNTPQTVTVTGVDDEMDDGDVIYSIVTAAASSIDLTYDGLNPANVSVTNTDNDTAGVTVSAISGATTEAGVTATFTVQLNTQPTADVLIGISSSDTTEGTVAPTSVTLTPGNWNAPQTVTVTGVNDDVDDGNIAYSIVLAAATSVDSVYSALNPDDVSVSNTDNDSANITVSVLSGNTSEAGATATATLVLASEPTADVGIAVSSSNTAEGTVSPTSLTFTAGNWSVPQTVTATGVDDAVDDGNIGYTIITAAATSVDVNYSGLNASNIAATNTDNDTAGIVLTESLDATEVKEGDYTDSYTIVLSSQPTAAVTVTIASTTAETEPSPAMLTFTTDNWSTPQTVTVTAVDDRDIEGSQSDLLTQSVTSADPLYDGIVLAAVSVAMTDNDHRSSLPVQDPILTAQKTVTVISPSAEAVTVSGTATPIVWTSTGVMPVVSIFLSIDGGETWTIMRYNNANVGSTTITMPNITSTHAVVKVEGSDLATTLASDVSDEFTIASAVGILPEDDASADVVVAPEEASQTPAEDAARVATLPSSTVVNMLVKKPDDGNPETHDDAAVYSVGTDGYRHAFPNANVYFSWYTDFANVVSIPASDLAEIAVGTNVTYKPGVKMVKFESSPKVYAVDQFGVLRWVISEDVAIQLYGFLWNTQIDIISDAFFKNYAFSTTISSFSDFDPGAFADLVNPSESMK